MSIQPFRWRNLVALGIVLLISLLILGSSSVPPGDQTSRVRAFTRAIEFDFVEWTLDALALKGGQNSLAAAQYIREADQSDLVLGYLELVRQSQDLERQIQNLYADPQVRDPETATQALRQELTRVEAQKVRLGPLAEAILQEQLQQVLSEMDFNLGGQSLPPVLYHTTSPPMALIVSPRDAIRQDENISIDPNLTTDQQAALEAQVDDNLDVSSLVVSIGGIGLYPTMVVETSNINWLAEVVAHEWIHNFLTLRPLGVLYLETPELRTINETVASIAGKELGRALVARFYPEHLPPPPEPPVVDLAPADEGEPPGFDFRSEMGKTRVRVDELLAEGQVEAAEAYMEARRQVFWENGYRLRKINQAYFAFYGAYADRPGGASGEDPVGDAVRSLRTQSGSLAEFVKRASWLTSFQQLQELLQQV